MNNTSTLPDNLLKKLLIKKENLFNAYTYGLSLISSGPTKDLETLIINCRFWTQINSLYITMINEEPLLVSC